MSTAVYRDDKRTVAENAQWLLHMATVYLSLPVFLFAFGWLNTGAAFIAVILLAYALYTSWNTHESSTPVFEIARRLWNNNAAAFTVLLIWCCLSGTGGIGYQNSDYAASNALLKDLIQNSWPLKLNDNVPMVYYVFYYLPAAAVGKLFGWQLANGFIFLWTYLGLLLIWSIFSIAIRLDSLTMVRKIFATIAFIFAGGWDFFGALLNYAPSVLNLGAHIEWWASIGQFSSHTTLLFWVPQHTIAPWIVTAVLLLVVERNLGRQVLWFLAALSFLWSPMASLGLVPFLALIFIRDVFNQQSVAFNSANFFAGPILALLGLFFYSSNAFKFPLQWLFETPSFTRNFILLFLLETIAFSLPFFIQHFKSKIYLNRIDLPPPENLSAMQKNFGWTAIIILVLLPTFKFGIMNDLCMRASIPALFVLFSFWVRILRREFTYQYLKIAVTFMCVLLGAASGTNEIYRSLANYSFGAPDVNRVSTLLGAQNNDVIEQRAGRLDSFFWRWIGPQSRNANLPK